MKTNPTGPARFRGAWIEKGQPEYDAARAAYNRRVDIRPEVNARCRGVADVISAVLAARDRDLEVHVRCTGYNIGVPAKGNGIVVDLSLMRGTQILPTQRIARVQGGVNGGDLQIEAAMHGLGGVTGVLSGTGVGLMLAGGIGHLAPRVGYATDNILSVELVTATGEVVTASPETNADLYWAVRGSTGNFGVVTALELQLHDVPPLVQGGAMSWSLDNVARGIEALRSTWDSASDDLSVIGLLSSVSPGDPGGLTVLVCHSGTEERAREDLGHLRSFAPDADDVVAIPFRDLHFIYDDTYPARRAIMNDVGVTVLSDALADHLVASVREPAGGGSHVVELVPRRGALGRAPASPSALRETAQEPTWCVSPACWWESDREDGMHERWLTEVVTDIRRIGPVNDIQHPNAVGVPTTPEDVARMYGDRFSRLRELKREWDPDNVFAGSHNIPPAQDSQSTTEGRQMEGARTRSSERSMVAVESSVTDWLAVRRPMLIGGEAVDSGQTLEVEDPATGRRIAEVAEASAEDVARAVASARTAFDRREWRWLPGAARGRLILAAAAAIDHHAEELAQLDALDGGIPISVSRPLISSAVETMEYAAGIPARIAGSAFTPANLRGDQFEAKVVREPLGVVAQIVPWNAPAATAIEKIVFALATGNTVVLKPAEQTPLSALRLAEILADVDLPPGVLNVVPGLGPVAGAALVEDPRVDKVSFTGSTVTGRSVVAAAATNLTPVSLELGGKSPFIVFADADLAAAAEAAASNAFLLSGQFCTAPSRMLVERRALDDFLSELSTAAEALAVGSPLDPATMVGPLVSSAQRERVVGYVESGLRDGADLVCGGAPVAGRGHFFQPTVLTGTTPAMAVDREEIFGPVVSVTPFDTVDQAISRANDTKFGLAAGVWTSNLKVSQRLTRDLQAGTVWINCYHVFDPALPFGGYKQSGWGRESGTAAVEEYTQTKTVTAAT